MNCKSAADLAGTIAAVRHTSSAIFAIPLGARPGGFVGEGLCA